MSLMAISCSGTVRAFAKCSSPAYFIQSSIFHSSRAFVPSLSCSTSSDEDSSKATASRSKRRVAIVGGGLAGLSTAYHLLQKTQRTDQPLLELCIFDTHPVGMGGASSIAGGLLHPLSPSGKLVHFGLEGLQATNQLLDIASQHFNEESGNSSIVLQDSVYRVALSPEQQSSLQALATTEHKAMEDFNVQCQWLSPDELDTILNDSYLSTTTAAFSRSHFGALKLSGNAKVVHVPSYLRGLWKTCCHFSDQTAQWIITERSSNKKEWLVSLQEEFDIVVLAAGAGLFQRQPVLGNRGNIESPSTLSSSTPDGDISLLSLKDFPIQLVRGQSIEMQRRQRHVELSETGRNGPLQPALVCGKYVLPTTQRDRILVGATHEFQSIPWTVDQVLEDVRERTKELLPSIWERNHRNDGTNVERDEWEVVEVASGVRVQANRSAQGRLPIMGHLHSNVWVFTGLSSRGLLYHALFGDYLTDSILNALNSGLQDSQEPSESSIQIDPTAPPLKLNWWKKKAGVKS